MNSSTVPIESPQRLTHRNPLSHLLLKRLALLLLTSAGLGFGQSVDLTGIAHAAFRVTDIARTSDFYQRLGFVQAFAFSKDGKTSQAFIKINDRQFIELYSLTPRDSTAGFMHLCFEASDLVSLNAAYRERGLTPIKVQMAHAGNLLFTMVGPEDQNIEYTQYLPGSLHSEDQSKHLGKHRISKRLLAISIAMHDPAAARTFYTEQLSFVPGISGDTNSLLLPGSSGESIEIKSLDNHALPDLLFHVDHVQQTTKELSSRGFDVHINPAGIYIIDPDGTMIEFTSGPSQR